MKNRVCLTNERMFKTTKFALTRSSGFALSTSNVFGDCKQNKQIFK